MEEQQRKKELQKTYFILLGLMIGGAALVLGGQFAWNSIQKHFAKSSINNDNSTAISTTPSEPKVVPQSPTNNQTIARNNSSLFTEQKAVDLINNWQNAKRKIFAYPFDLLLLKKYQTDKKYQDNVGSVNWLRNNNAYYKYGVQSVDSVEEFIASGDRATIDAVVTEQRTFYMNNKVINDGNTAFDTRLVRYNLVSENGQWKIEDYNTVKKIKTR